MFLPKLCNTKATSRQSVRGSIRSAAFFLKWLFGLCISLDLLPIPRDCSAVYSCQPGWMWTPNVVPLRSFWKRFIKILSGHIISSYFISLFIFIPTKKKSNIMPSPNVAEESSAETPRCAGFSVLKHSRIIVIIVLVVGKHLKNRHKKWKRYPPGISSQRYLWRWVSLFPRWDMLVPWDGSQTTYKNIFEAGRGLQGTVTTRILQSGGMVGSDVFRRTA